MKTPEKQPKEQNVEDLNNHILWLKQKQVEQTNKQTTYRRKSKHMTGNPEKAYLQTILK